MKTEPEIKAYRDGIKECTKNYNEGVNNIYTDYHKGILKALEWVMDMGDR